MMTLWDSEAFMEPRKRSSETMKKAGESGQGAVVSAKPAPLTSRAAGWDYEWGGDGEAVKADIDLERRIYGIHGMGILIRRNVERSE